MQNGQTSAFDRVSAGYSCAPSRSLLFDSPSRIPTADATDLRWYFRNPSLVVVPESGFSGQLERAAAFSFGVMPCLKCGGSRAEPERDGSGWQPTGKLAKLGYLAALKQCRAEAAKKAGLLVVSARTAEVMTLFTGFEGAEKVKTISEPMLAELVPYVPDHLCIKCKRCLGTGVVERRTGKSKSITARPTGGSMEGGGDAPEVSIDTEGVVRYGKVSRVLELVARRRLWDRLAIQVYFSDGGGSVLALWPYTKSGGKLLSQVPNPDGLPPGAVFEQERRRRHESGYTRAKQLAAVEREASERWDNACRNWNEAAKQ
jgi:hypothetical protein